MDEFFIKRYNDTANLFAQPSLLNRIGNDLYWTFSTQSRVIKTDENFEIIWEAELSYSSGQHGGPKVYSCVESHTSGEIILQGTFWDTSASQIKLFLAKITAAGNLVWEKYYDIEITGVYSGNSSDYIKPFGSNYILRAYESILIINENGNIIHHKRRRVTGSSQYYQVRGLEVYNNQVYVLYNTINLGDVVILDNSLNFLSHFRFFGNPERNINAEIRMSRIGSKLFIGFQDVSINVGILPIDIVSDLGSSATSGSLTAKRFTNSFQYDSQYPNELFIANSNLFLFGYTEGTVSNQKTVIYRLDDNLNVNWIQQNESIFSPSGFYPTQNAIFLNHFYNTGNDFGLLKAPDSLNPSCYPFTPFTDNLISFGANWVKQSTNEMEAHSVTDLGVGATIAFIPHTEILQICPQTYDLDESTISAASSTISANGSSQTLVTVQLKDYQGTNLSGGGETVVISTSAGTIGATTDNGDGTYTATLTSSTIAETATLSFTINGEAATATTAVTFTQAINISLSTITADPNSIDADGTSTSQITVQLNDYAGASMATGGETVVITTSAGTIGATTDNGDGTYTATLTSSSTAETATLSFTLNGANIPKTVQVSFAQAINVDLSTISANPTTINADGVSTSAITVQLKDYTGANLTTGGATVVISTDQGTLSTTMDNGDGTYTATLTSSTISGTATLSFTVNGENATDTVAVIFEEVIIRVPQSPHLYLQAAGSTGTDGSLAGIHLRWLLKKDLIKHLPKGNLATSTANYNKPDDFVQLFRAPYVAAPTTFDLTQTPVAVENRQAIWMYQVNDIKVYLYFRNRTKYNTVRATLNPLAQATQFLAAYGNELLQLESKNELFFSVAFETNSGASPVVETEVLSVEANTFVAEKVITARKTFTGTGALSNTKIVTENGRSFRFRPTDCEITSITLEFYNTLADSIESGAGWTALGNFSLSTTDSEVFNRLEPTTDSVNGQWPRFNDDAFVNIQNYRDKWNVTNPVTQSTIKQTVQDYVTLSDDVNNPAAVESFTFSDVLPEGVTNPEDDSFELSNLTLLQQAAFDFHVARMLGLGHLDVDAAVQNNDAFVYMAVYETQVSLQNGSLVAEDTEHRYITVPTSKLDERLPLPVNLKTPVPGLFPNNGNNQESLPLTDSDGYTEDGKARFISLFVDEPEDLSVDRGFYDSTTEFNSTENTQAVFAGIEYKAVGEADWIKPELPNTDQYLNAVPSGQSPHNETVELPLPDEGVALFVHRERATGEHVYGSYGINWFSRAVQSSVQWNITTTIQPKDKLIPPHNRNALLVVEESPLLLTSAAEQQLLSNISGSDKTLIRLVFDYHTRQELLTYKVTPDNMAGATDPLDANAIFPDSQEIFGDEIELYFREELPLNVTGRALSVQDHPTNEVLSIITTGEYLLDSTGEPLTPSIPGSQLSNFVGGVFVLEETEYIIHEVTSGTSGPDFTVYKKQLSDRLLNSDVPAANEELQAPTITADGMFIAVENLLNVSSWGSPNPHPLNVQIGDNWSVHRELVEGEGPDDGPEQLVEKSRGIWGDALVEEVTQTVGFDGSNQPILEHRGAYKATFSATQLANHPQNAGTHPVQWHNGIVRIRTVGNPTGSRKSLDVFKTENIGTANNLVVYFVDTNFSTAPEYDPIQTGTFEVNYYPGYRVYLYADATAGITENTVLPTPGQGIKYSCFGFRTLGNSGSYSSRISTPTVFFAQEVIEPLPPELPVGSLFATRPDSFGKATYTLTTQFTHTPHGVQYYRSEDNAILNTLYSPQTAETVKQELGNADPAFLGNRWQNVLGFDYQYPQGSFQTDGLFAIYPEDASGYRLPNPDNESLFSGGETPGNIDPGNMTDRIKSAVLSVFTPLTEIPILYEFINDSSYQPVPKPQVVRDRNGALLDPNNSSEFDMAPMAKIVTANNVQFTDFGLDGTSNNVYFYAVREVGNRMALSEFSPVLGPVTLVNTNAPIAPGIKKVVPILENDILGIPAQMRIEINAYPKVEGIKKIALYRTLSASNALSLRSMDLISESDLEQSGQLASDIWEITDDFSDLAELPFGDPLYYRAVALREIQYTNKDDPNTVVTEYVPSQASKLMVSAIVENENPISPLVNYTADPVNANFELPNVVLNWEKTAYNPKYLLYKMNSQGQWAKIHEVLSNAQTVSVPLETTDLGANFLVVEDMDNDNQNIYHHFKVVVENTSGLLSTEEEILTIPQN